MPPSTVAAASVTSARSERQDKTPLRISQRRASTHIAMVGPRSLMLALRFKPCVRMVNSQLKVNKVELGAPKIYHTTM